MSISQTSSTRNSAKGWKKNKALLVWGLIGLLVFFSLLSLRCGSQNYPLSQMFSALANGERESPQWRVFMYVRVPRTLACILSGCALAAAGVLIQAVLNNAMASPNVIGVNAGAGFFAILAATLLPWLPGIIPAASFIGALCTALLIYGLAVRRGLSRTTLVLAGITVSSILTAGINTITLLFPDATIGANGFMLGGFSGVTLETLKSAVGYIGCGLLLAAFMSANLNVLRLGEETAASLGLNVGLTRFLSVLAAALLAGAAVSFSGLLGFVGLLVPHAARHFVGSDQRWLLFTAALMGAIFLLGCDILSRVLFAPFEFPVGIMMSLLGGPFFLSLLLRHKRSKIYD